jgi:alanine racemase
MNPFRPFWLQGPGPWACIDPTAMAHNLNWLRQRLLRNGGQARPRLWTVLKAEAYGHGLNHALKALGDADGVALASLEDVARVRRQGWTGPVLLLSTTGMDPADLSDPAFGELHFVVDDPAALERLEQVPAPFSERHAWLRYAGHLRTHGFDDKRYADAYQRLQALVHAGRLAGAGHFHHYAAAEDPGALAQERQAFDAVSAGLPGPRCTENSAALCSDAPLPSFEADHWLRAGLLLYGASALPGRSGSELGLRPAMSLHARLLAIRPVAAGETVGYGDSYRAPHDTNVGVVGIGYGHGIPRDLWRRGQLLAGRDGRPVRVAGRVAMDCLTVDLGPQPPDQPGDIMTLWGETGAGAALPVEEVAQACDTIAAEMLTRLTARTALVVRPKTA